MNKNKKITFAVIGSFWLTEKMIHVFDSSDKVRYVAQYSRSIERAREFVGSRDIMLFDNISELAADKSIDAVYVASPNYLHYEHAGILLESGKHVLCEKPVCVTPGQFFRLCEISDKREVVFMEAMMNAHLPWINEIGKVVFKNKIISANINFCQRSSKLERLKEGNIASTFNKDCAGGVLMDLGVYVISFLVQLFGKPENVSANAVYGGNNVDVTDNLLLKYKDFSVTVNISKMASSCLPSEIITDNCSVVIDNISRLQNVKVIDGNNNSVLIHGISDYEDCMRFELDDFISYINGNNEEYLKKRKNTADTLETMSNIGKLIGYNV